MQHSSLLHLRLRATALTPTTVATLCLGSSSDASPTGRRHRLAAAAEETKAAGGGAAHLVPKGQSPTCQRQEAAQGAVVEVVVLSQRRHSLHLLTAKDGEGWGRLLGGLEVIKATWEGAFMLQTLMNETTGQVFGGRITVIVVVND